MLRELRIRNFAIIDEVTLHFDEGLLVFTGETGAGKSIIVDAIELLLGGRADGTVIRTGADTASVEGDFILAGETANAVKEILDPEGLWENDRSLTLSREVRREGRNLARINGRTINVAILKDVGQILVDVHGQSEHLSLLRVREHIRLLDRYAGLAESAAAFAIQVETLRQVRKELTAIRSSERESARRVDMLQFQIGEIESARIKPGEDAALGEERTRLANAEQLANLADEVINALDEESEDRRPATDLLGQAVHALTALAKIDSSLSAVKESGQAALDQASELVRQVRTYRDSIEFNPRRLEQVEERVELLRNLKHKYGDSLEAVLAHAEKSHQELEGITHAGERITELETRERSLLAEIGKVGQVLSSQRQQAAEKLSRGIEAELADLRMNGASFSVDIHWEEDPAGALVEDKRIGFDLTGLDHVEFLIAPNPGEGMKPLAKVASGGETSRLMLALKSVLAHADQTPTLIFDEIDQGIGGRVGLTVGRKLWNLTPDHQVFCVTHLPQLAAYGDNHFHVAKTVEGNRTVTRVKNLGMSDRIGELAIMLGTDSQATRGSAEELLDVVTKEKAKGKSVAI